MDILRYLEAHLRPLVDTELVKLAEHFHRQINGRGHFSIPREVFCYVDHLGELAVGGLHHGSACALLEFFLFGKMG